MGLNIFWDRVSRLQQKLLSQKKIENHLLYVGEILCFNASGTGGKLPPYGDIKKIRIDESVDLPGSLVRDPGILKQ